ncbi:MAG: acyl-CoA dehydrogenase [Gammaproteobacteria bacterium]|nr:acyl-CoA dehydrogenase [Gammaproteobacteria bacterium]
MFDLTDVQKQIVVMAQEFADAQLWPHASTWDLASSFPQEALIDAAKLGFAGLFAREDIGGINLSRLDVALIFESLATGCVSTSAFLSIHNMVLGLVDKYATAEIRANWGPRLSQFSAIGSYCLTEPQSGSDAASLQSKAIDCGDHYLINGAKAFISGAGVSDVYVTMLRTADEGYRGISCFLIPKDIEGVRFGQKEMKMGWRNQPTAMVYFENCKLPKSHLMGELGMGFRYALQALNGGRINISACSLGGAKRALIQTEAYMRERSQFKQHLKDMPALRQTFAKMLTQYEASKTFLLKAASSLDAGANSAPRYCAMAKQLVTEACTDIVNQSIQLHGGYGYLHDYQVERIYRDIRVHEILEGSNQIMNEIIAKAVLDDEQDWKNEWSKS